MEKKDKLKLIEIIDSMEVKDSFDLHINDVMKNDRKNNHLVMFDMNGNVIGEAFNKIVSSGKVEQIENMFRQYDISDKYGIQYQRPDNITNPRWISVFGVGSGGAPLAEGNLK